ncbi:MAG: hypothetical protein KDD61_18040, partial [Bdellovibrionales bacterium]|nr:hypothetical protein [Bdellovibrionales bacterium]
DIEFFVFFYVRIRNMLREQEGGVMKALTLYIFLLFLAPLSSADSFGGGGPGGGGRPVIKPDCFDHDIVCRETSSNLPLMISVRRLSPKSRACTAQVSLNGMILDLGTIQSAKTNVVGSGYNRVRIDGTKGILRGQYGRFSSRIVYIDLYTGSTTQSLEAQCE